MRELERSLELKIEAEEKLNSIDILKAFADEETILHQLGHSLEGLYCINKELQLFMATFKTKDNKIETENLIKENIEIKTQSGTNFKITIKQPEKPTYNIRLYPVITETTEEDIMEHAIKFKWGTIEKIERATYQPFPNIKNGYVDVKITNHNYNNIPNNTNINSKKIYVKHPYNPDYDCTKCGKNGHNDKHCFQNFNSNNIIKSWKNNNNQTNTQVRQLTYMDDSLTIPKVPNFQTLSESQLEICDITSNKTDGSPNPRHLDVNDWPPPTQVNKTPENQGKNSKTIKNGTPYPNKNFKEFNEILINIPIIDKPLQTNNISGTANQTQKRKNRSSENSPAQTEKPDGKKTKENMENMEFSEIEEFSESSDEDQDDDKNKNKEKEKDQQTKNKPTKNKKKNKLKTRDGRK